MTALTADLFVSADGFAAAENAGPFFDLGGPELTAWVRTELSRPQVLLMGRVTFELMAPMTASAGDEDSVRMTSLPKVVFSNTIDDATAWANTTVLNGDLAESIESLKCSSTSPIRSFGSITLVKGLMRAGLVDRLRLMIFPLTVGSDGREPAFAGYPRTGLELTSTTLLDGRLLLLEYRPESGSATA
jgi:dihydrofolate reductase